VILIDTTPLVALCDSRDEYHGRAVEHLKALVAPKGRQSGRRDEARFATCDGVITEACFHLPHAVQRRRLQALLDELRVVVLPDQPDAAFRDQIFDWLVKYGEHEPDWADGCLAVLSGRDPAARLWTYDREFRTTWRRPDGSRIPLAV